MQLNPLALALSTAGGSRWTPLNLFFGGTQGLWYDLNDDNTIFQDSAGTTLATWGDPVGLVLDKHEGLALGTELVTNGTFTTDTDWIDADTGTGSSVIAGGVLTLNGTDASNRAIRRQSITTVVGITYRIQSQINAAGLTVVAQTSATLGVGVLAVLTQASQSAYFTATTTTTFINIYTSPSGSGTVDNVTVKSIAGNHAIQATGGFRMIRGRMPKRGRVNLVAPSENFADASWTKTNCSITSGVVTTSATSDGLSRALTNYNANTSHAWTFRVSTGTATWLRFVCFHTTATANRVSGWFNIAGGVVGSATNGGTGTGAAISAVEVSAGVYDVTLTGAVNNSAANVTIQISTATADLSTTGVSGVTYTPVRTQLEAGAATAYQRVIDSLGFNVTESGQPSCGYLSFNGSNQWMQTAAAVNFTATDEMSVFAGVRKVSDPVDAALVELNTPNWTSAAGSFILGAPITVGGTLRYYAFGSRGTAAAGTAVISNTTSASFIAPVYSVITGLADISADQNLLRANGAQVGSATGDQGTGNYGNYVTYFGARGGTSLYFNGLMFSTIIRGALTSGTLLTITEQYVARQTPTVTL